MVDGKFIISYKQCCHHPTIEERLNVIGEWMQFCHNKFSEIEEAIEMKINTKKPHKCPVCNGITAINYNLPGSALAATCHTCKGEGVLWG